ncbi:hypothetical protein SAMN05216345_111171 [Cupriavidus sp. YR651]|uniref:hypothetical protein n=1 Tax=Cupriavidus sp. YR651 TaxID=1855315 RepID=UPI0008842ED6|nr:hypothetical protein [Cupriavidus sp. YR651]SDD58989.1 hypothetical protein SAMN05216345_111171 [Cupriavidus sp. YR651]
MADTLSDYFQALERLKRGIPKIVPKDTKISNDAVALEAGRGKGSIKKSRPVFRNLIEAIDEVAAKQGKPKEEVKKKLASAQTSASNYRLLWEEALAREASLLVELIETRKELAKLTGEKVLPIRGRRP